MAITDSKNRAPDVSAQLIEKGILTAIPVSWRDSGFRITITKTVPR